MVQNLDKSVPRKGGLGKGISSLLGDEAATDHPAVLTPSMEVSATQSMILDLPIELIVANPRQPRKYFDEAQLTELSESIGKDGIIQPIIVSPHSQKGIYIIVAGERRWRAAKLAGIPKIPVLVKETAEKDLLRVALIENIQRQDLNIIEEAEAYQLLIQEQSLTHDQCAEMVGKDRASISNTIRLLSLPREIQDDVSNGRMTMGHGKAILGLENQKLMLRCREMILKRQLNVRQTEQLVQNLKNPKKKQEPGSLQDADLNYLAEMLRSYFQTKIKISGKSSKGKIEISYFSASELERLLKLMGQPLG